MDCSKPGFLSFTISQSLLRFLSIGSVMQGELGFSSVQFSRSVVSDSLQPHELQHARPPCPSETPEFTQTHVDWIDDAIQPSHPLSPSSPPAFNLSQHQGLFQWVSCLHHVAKELELQLVGTSCSCILYAGYISIFALIYLTLNSTYYISGIFYTHHKY